VRYREILDGAHALDFDDLLLRTVALLAQDELVRDSYRQRFRYLLVDEYQDTNRTQYQLVRLLCGEAGNVTVVGDEDQSIYSWRGAEIQNILDFEHDFPGARILRLEENYRSSQRILDAAAGLVALDSMVDRLAEDHAHARRLAEGVAELPRLRLDLASVETNIVIFNVDHPGGAGLLVTGALARKVKIHQIGPTSIRCVTHKDVDAEDVGRALEAFREITAAW